MPPFDVFYEGKWIGTATVSPPPLEPQPIDAHFGRFKVTVRPMLDVELAIRMAEAKGLCAFVREGKLLVADNETFGSTTISDGFVSLDAFNRLADGDRDGQS